MGLCASSETEEQAAARREEAKRAKAIDLELRQSKKDDQQVHKLLLLGAGESGKSTLFKQMITLYKGGFTERERVAYLPVICNNLIGALKTLCEHAGLHGDDTFVAPQLEDVRKYVIDMKMPDTLDADTVAKVKLLWADPGIKNTFDRRAAFQLIDSASYFLDHVEMYAHPNYIPTSDDVLRCRVRTTGIVENTFVINDNNFKVMDVGGQRNERKKWIHCFSEVTAVIFVAALSEYDMVLFEDETVNRMDEALALFTEIGTSPWFRNTSIILFLNKRDLFAEKITKVPLTKWRPEYTGRNTYEDAAMYILDLFRSKLPNHNAIYSHITCATDTNNIRVVFQAVQDTVIQQGLAEGGLI